MSPMHETAVVHDADEIPAGRPSRAAAFREILRELVSVEAIRGGMLVAPDGFVIAAELPEGTPEDALAALAATLGRHLELGGARLGRGPFSLAMFTAEDGTLFLGGSPLGFLAVLGGADVNVGVARQALRRAGEALRQAWETGERRANS